MTEPMTLKENFQKNPYFDDFLNQNDYYKILFKKDTELQTRELNQIQSIIQKQIERLGSFVFKNGSIVYGCNNKVNTSVYSASLDETYNFTRYAEYLSYFENLYVISNTSGRKIGKLSQVLHSSNNTFKPESIIIFNSVSGEMFAENDIISLYHPETEQILSDYSLKITAINKASTVSFSEGVLFINGYFLYINDQRKIISPYDNKPSVSIGFNINENIITSNEDVSLFDNAFIEDKEGYYNPLSSGADRYKISGEITIREKLTNTNFAEQFNTGNFFEFIRVETGEIIKNVTTSIYSELEKTLAQRTYDESGSYTVRPFTCKIKASTQSTDNFTLEISSGKAYVLGYEFDSISTRTIDIKRALKYETKESFDIATYYGSYVKLENYSGFFDVQKCARVNLYSNILNDLTSDSIDLVGTARVRHCRKIGSLLWVYLFDVKVDKGTFEDIKSLKVSNTSEGTGKGDLNSSMLFSANDNSFIFKFPETEIKEIITASYTVQKSFLNQKFNNSIDSSEPEDVVYSTIKVSPNEQLYNSNTNILIVDKLTGEYIIPSTLTYLDEDGTSLLIKIIGKTPFIADILAIVDIKTAIEKQATKVSTTIITKETSFENGQKIILDGIYLGCKILSIVNADNIPFDNYFEIVIQENLSLYSETQLKYIGSETLSNSPLTIKLEYIPFSLSGYFSLKSFESIDNIPDISLSNQAFQKRNNCLDFRPVQINNVITDALIPTPYGTFECSYSYYLSRIDKLIVTSAKDFAIIEGIDAYKPNVPSDRLDGMTLYTISIPAGTSNPDIVTLEFHENKRYTMRDIGKLEKRIENLEYYTSLSLLEKDVESFEIKDQSGNNRFKNGFLIDNFKNFKSLDYSNSEVSCSYDLREGLLRPSFDMINVKGRFYESKSNAIKVGDIILLPYKEVPFIQQLQCSEIMNLQPYEVFSWDGYLSLNPETDEWVDTETKPDVNVNQMGETDIWADIGSRAFKMEWGSWETKITQTSPEKPLTAQEKGNFANIAIPETLKLWNPTVDASVGSDMIKHYDEWVASGYTTWFTQTKPDGFVNGKPAILIPFKSFTSANVQTGKQLAFDNSKIISNSLGEKVTDVSIVPFMRNQKVTFSAKNLKPNTVLYAFFDGKDVTKFCQQDNVINAGELKTDYKGNISGIFDLPGGVFNIGSKLFRLCDDQFNNAVFITTVCERKYTANGLKQTKEETILSTRDPQLTTIVKENIKNEKSVYAWGNTVLRPTPTPTPTISPEPIYPKSVKIILDAPFLSSIKPSEKLNIDYMLLLDRSGSMGNDSASLNNIKTNLFTALSNDGKNNFGLWFFRDETGPVARFSTPLKSTLDTSLIINTPYSGFTGTESPLQSFEMILDDYLAANKSNFSVNNYRFVLLITDEADEKIQSLAGNPASGDRLSKDAYLKKLFDKMNKTEIYPIVLVPANQEYGSVEVNYRDIFTKYFNGLGEVISVNLTGQLDTQKIADAIKKTTTSLKEKLDNKITLSTVINGIETNLIGFLNRDALTIETEVIETTQDFIDLKLIYDPEIKVPQLTTAQLNTINFNLEFTDFYLVNYLECKVSTNYNKFNVPQFLSLDKRTEFNDWFNSLSNSIFKFIDPNLNKQFTFNWHMNNDFEITRAINKLFKTSYVLDNGQAILNLLKIPDFANNKLIEGIRYIIKNQIFTEKSLHIPLTANKLNLIVIRATAAIPKFKSSIIDPLAQSFNINSDEYPDGIFLTSLDLFFKTKSENKPVRVELRQSVNGFPHSSEYIPLSQKILDPDEIFVSNDSSIPTHIAFDSPIYLLPGEYHFCVISDSIDYNVYVAKLGDFQLGSATERIEKNAYAGVLFKSANASTWIPQPDTDFKFVLYRASFPVNQETSVVLINEEPLGLDFNYNSICLNSMLIKPANTTITTPIFNLTQQNLSLSEEEFEINFNETSELNNTFLIREI